MGKELRILIEDKDDAVDKVIHTGLRAFNRTRVNWPGRQPFNVVLRDGGARVLGGILASVSYDVLVLEDVFVEEQWRGDGYGAKLMARAEGEGIKRGARLAVVSTFSWQARPFYEKLGYAVYAEVPYNGGTYVLHSLKKSLCA